MENANNELCKPPSQRILRSTTPPAPSSPLSSFETTSLPIASNSTPTGSSRRSVLKNAVLTSFKAIHDKRACIGKAVAGQFKLPSLSSISSLPDTGSSTQHRINEKSLYANVGSGDFSSDELDTTDLLTRYHRTTENSWLPAKSCGGVCDNSCSSSTVATADFTAATHGSESGHDSCTFGLNFTDLPPESHAETQKRSPSLSAVPQPLGPARLPPNLHRRRRLRKQSKSSARLSSSPVRSTKLSSLLTQTLDEGTLQDCDDTRSSDQYNEAKDFLSNASPSLHTVPNTSSCGMRTSRNEDLLTSNKSLSLHTVSNGSLGRRKASHHRRRIPSSTQSQKNDESHCFLESVSRLEIDSNSMKQGSASKKGKGLVRSSPAESSSSALTASTVSVPTRPKVHGRSTRSRATKKKSSTSMAMGDNKDDKIKSYQRRRGSSLPPNKRNTSSSSYTAYVTAASTSHQHLIKHDGPGCDTARVPSSRHSSLHDEDGS